MSVHGSHGSRQRSRPRALLGWGREEFATAAGTRMHAAVLDPPAAARHNLVVCVHGLGCSHRYFGPLAFRLAPVTAVAAPDLPGFGRTAGPPEALDIRGLSLALADWLRVTGRGGAVLVGNSAGCQVVADLAVHAPELLGPVVLAGPTVDPSAPTAVAQLGRLLQVAPREPLALTALLARDYLVCGPSRFAATFRHMLAHRIERALPQLHTPSVVVRGSRDPVAPHAWVTQAAALLPAGRSVELPKAAHALNFSAPDGLAGLVRELLEA